MRNRLFAALSISWCACYAGAGRYSWTPIKLHGWTVNPDTNCYQGRGADEVLDVYMSTITGEVNRPDAGAVALLKCRMRCDSRRRDGCMAFTVHPSALGSLHCWLRKDVHLAACDRDATRFYTYTRWA